MNEADRQMALLLQKQFEMETNTEKPTNNLVYHDKKKKHQPNKDPTKSLIDPSWELVDPTPNIHILFVAFNDRFFWNKLHTVTVAWSKRMTSCAGICAYQSRGGVCKITLSEPLLKLRPRKDLIETLLHEMIHALLFVTNNNRDRDGHGPEFHKHMYRINNEAGTGISVYHDFHDEVRLYKQHWWRCNGSCQQRRPFFGFVRRAMNRAPGPNDRWWAEHQQTCGGKFIKVKEPEKPAKKTKETKEKKTKEIKSNSGDIRKFIDVTKNKNSSNVKVGDNIKTINSINGAGAVGTKNKNGTVLLNPKTAKPESNKVNTPNKPKSNIFTLKDINTENNNNLKDKKPKNKPTNGSNANDNAPNIDYSVVRNHWLDKFDKPTTNKDVKRKNEDKTANSPKKIKTETKTILIPDESDKVNCPVCKKLFADSELNEHLDKCLQNDLPNQNIAQPKLDIKTDKKPSFKMVQCPSCNKFVDDKELNSHLDICLTKVTEEPSTSKKNKKITSNLIHCEICDKFIPSESHPKHTADCLNKFYDDIEKKYNISSEPSGSTSCLVCSKDILKVDLDGHLDSCMGSAFDGNMEEEAVNDESSENSNENEETKNEEKNEAKAYNCPLCLKLIPETDMNKHIDDCLTINNFDFNDF